jgi:hypothetical protein
MHWMLFLLLFISCYAEEKIFFLHIPKSGGLTLRAILTDHYSVGTYKSGSKLDGVFDSLADYSLVCQHFRYFDVKESFVDFMKMTFLRDPVSRVISEHHYILDRNHPKKGTAGVLKDHFLPSEGDPIETAENIACKCLSRLNPLDSSIPIEKHLESAKESLAHDFDFIGITERMEESIALFCNLVGWEIPAWTPTHNTTPRKISYSQEILDAIALRNWADIALYKYAIELFEKQKTNIASRTLAEQVEWVDRVDFDFRAPLDGWGWCPRESWPEGVFRWLCTPEQGLIAFPLQSGKNYVLEAQLHIPSSLLSKFRLLVNGTIISYITKKLEQSADQTNWFLVQATIPREYINEGKKTQIMFTIEDFKRKTGVDSYRGRCGSNRIRILPK